MIWYTKANIPEKTHKSSGRNSKIYNNSIFVLDIETTSLFRCSDGLYRSRTDIEELNGFENFKACMYIWMLSIDENVYYGRTISQLAEFLSRIMESAGIKLIFVHNLSYEFQFLLNIFEKSEAELSIFARATHKPIKINLGSIQFRCSYTMSQSSLEKLPKNFNLSIEKKTGDLDYSLERGYNTNLTSKEMEYCEHDCLVVYEFVKLLKKQYRQIENIPLTSTGRIRREARKRMHKSPKALRKVKEGTPDIETFELLRRLFIGGYVHANKIHALFSEYNVDSYDFASSYPTRIVCEKFPMERFLKSRRLTFDTKPFRRAFYHIKAHGVCTRGSMVYMSLSKCVRVSNAITDNGRIERADWMEFYATDIDIETFNLAYESNRLEILEKWESTAGYLPKPLVEYTLELFKAKTELKGIEDRIDEYNLTKQYINGLFGMCVTNDIRDDVLFDYMKENPWQVKEKTREEVAKELEKVKNSHNTFLMYQWGVWITAYARNALWKMIAKIGNDVVYCDTDSIKMLNSKKYTHLIEEANIEIKKKVSEAIKEQRIEIDYPPKDSKGIPHYLGVFEHESEYPVKEFRTLGAKKYAYVGKDGEFHMTLSGVSKSAAKSMKNGIEDFMIGYIFDKDVSGRTVARYLYNQEPFEFIDYTGKLNVISDQKYAICLEPSTYKLGAAPDYNELMNLSTRLAYMERMGIT